MISQTQVVHSSICVILEENVPGAPTRLGKQAGGKEARQKRSGASAGGLPYASTTAGTILVGELGG